MLLLLCLLPLSALALPRALQPRAATQATYTLKTDYGHDMAFFDKFDFFTEQDPTHGYVSYTDRSTAQRTNLISVDGKSVRMGVDSTNNVQPGEPGRKSVRLESKEKYGVGTVIVLDLGHMPAGVCGSWPAFWTVGPDWPNAGEIDIIEGVNTQSHNQVALHTGPNCRVTNSSSTNRYTGTLLTDNCDALAGDNSGCGVQSPTTDSYGDGFNQAGGGIYAMELRSEGVGVWFWPRGKVPGGIGTRNAPRVDTRKWGVPLARFKGDCNINSHFREQRIVFNIAFCGDWADSTWGTGECKSKANSCQEFVAGNPAAFRKSFWRVNSLRVYQA